MGLFNSGVNRGIRTLMEQSKNAGVGEQAIHNFMGRNGLKTVGGALSDAGGIVAGAGLAGGVLGATTAPLTGQDTAGGTISGVQSGAIIGGIIGGASLAYSLKKGKLVGGESANALKAGATANELRRIRSMSDVMNNNSVTRLQNADMARGNAYFAGRFQSNGQGGFVRKFVDGNTDSKFKMEPGSPGFTKAKKEYISKRRASLNQEQFAKQTQLQNAHAFNNALNAGATGGFSGAMAKVKSKFSKQS